MVQTGFGALGTQQQHGVATSGAAHVATVSVASAITLAYFMLVVVVACSLELFFFQLW